MLSSTPNASIECVQVSKILYIRQCRVWASGDPGQNSWRGHRIQNLLRFIMLQTGVSNFNCVWDDWSKYIGILPLFTLQRPKRTNAHIRIYDERSKWQKVYKTKSRNGERSKNKKEGTNIQISFHKGRTIPHQANRFRPFILSIFCPEIHTNQVLFQHIL